MTKLYLILYVFGAIKGTWGPLPYGIDECEHRASELRADIARHPEAMKGWTVACEWHEKRPQLAGRAALKEQTR